MDDIQRKLALIDRQLAGGRLAILHKQIVGTAPLLFVAVGLIAGIVIQDLFGLSIWLWLILLALCITSAAVSYLANYIRHLVEEENLPYVIAYIALMAFLCLGAMRLISFEQPRGDDICNFVGSERELTTDYTDKIKDSSSQGVHRTATGKKLKSVKSVKSAVKKPNERKLATIRGLIVTKPYVNREQDWEFARFMHTDPASSFYLKVKEIETVAGWAKVSGTVRVQVAEPVLDLKDGDFIQAYCWLDRFEGATNPGQFDIKRYLARRGVFAAASIESRDGIELLKKEPAAIFTKAKRKIRELAVQALLGSTHPQDEGERLLQALVLGYRAEMDVTTYEAFRKTGLLHFVCLSGMNFGILVGMIWWLCKTAGLMKRGRAVVCIIAAAMFVLVIPPNPPAFRAAIICLVFCLSFFFRRQSNPFNSLALAAVILLMIRPTELFEVSWQLSFASVLGILLLAKRASNSILEKVAALFEDPMTGKPPSYFRIVSGLISPIIAVFAISFAAWLVSAGILLYNFYTIQPLTSIWTVVASPFIAVISFAGYLKLLIGLVLPTTASILDVIIKPLSGWLIELVKYIAQRDFSQVLIGHVAIWLIVFYYCTILFIAFIHFKHPLVKKVISVPMVLAIIIFLGITKWQRTHRDDLVVTCLDVGHGQAILAQLPGGDNILFDGGSLYKNDVGRKVITPFLDHIGIDKISSIIISHGDIDHINGIPEITEHCELGSVYADEEFFNKAEKWGAAKFLSESLRKRGLEIQALSRELKVGSGTRIQFIWPDEEKYATGQLSDNDKSAVSLIEYGGRKVLLCSDIEKSAQRGLVQVYPNLRADIVVVPHHGSARTLEPDFLRSVGAGNLIYSCDQSQYERQQVIQGEKDANSFYTAKDGAVSVCVTKDGEVRTTAFVKKPRIKCGAK